MKIVANHYGGKEKPLWNEALHLDPGESIYPLTSMMPV
jgi:hypothetical protein